MSDVVLQKSVWDLLFARVFVDPTLVLLSGMDANICSEWARLIPDKVCVGALFFRNAMILASHSPSSSFRTLVLICFEFCRAREE